LAYHVTDVETVIHPGECKGLHKDYSMKRFNAQTSVKRLRAAYNNAYRSMHYILPRNVSVRPHQVSHCVKTFDAFLRNNLYRFSQRCASSSNFSSNLFKCLMLFTNLHFSWII